MAVLQRVVENLIEDDEIAYGVLTYRATISETA